MSPGAAALSNEHILLNIVEHAASTVTLLSMSLISSAIWHASRDVQKHLYTPHRLMALLFEHYDRRDAFFSSEHLLITGPPVLRYLADLSTRRANLVIVVSAHFLTRTLAFLARHGYSLFAAYHHTRTPSRPEPVLRTYCLRRGGVGAPIWVHVPVRSSFEVFLAQRSTLFLNCIHLERFISLCPRASILHRRGVELARPILVPQEPGELMAQPGGNPYGLRSVDFRIQSPRLHGLHCTLTPGTRLSNDRWAWIPGRAEPGDTPFPTFAWSLNVRVRRDGTLSLSTSVASNSYYP